MGACVLKHDRESHRSDRVGWLRASVLGANDGIVSTASLIVGIAAANASQSTIVLAGIAGLVGGAMSMAAGEYISVSSQADTENADLAMERDELDRCPAHELKELAGIYVKRGLTPELAVSVAEQLTAHDALAAHARDDADDFGAIVVHGHEVGYVDDAGLGVVFGLENKRVAAISAAHGLRHTSRRHAPAAVLGAAEKCGEAGATVEPGPAEPVDGAGDGDECCGFAVADEGVVLYGGAVLGRPVVGYVVHVS